MDMIVPSVGEMIWGLLFNLLILGAIAFLIFSAITSYNRKTRRIAEEARDLAAQGAAREDRSGGDIA
jgi:large-conductance mechanosensitive channel